MTTPEPPAPGDEAAPALPPASPAQSPGPSQAAPPVGAAAPPTGLSAPVPPASGALALGVILVAIGGLLLAGRLVELTFDTSAWQLWIVVPGLLMLIGSLAIPPRGGVGLAIPGAIVTMVGLVLWVQDTYDAYASWAYAWALVGPFAAGVGMALYGLVRGVPDLVRDGGQLALVGLALFAGFALFFEGVLGLSGDPIPNLDQVLPYLAIGVGVVLIVLSLLGSRRRQAS